MKRIPAVAIAIVLSLAACVGSSPQSPTVQLPTPTSSSIEAAAPAHDPIWITVKYRPSPVDVADPRFVNLGTTDSSVVTAAFYDQTNRYMIIVLNGVAYHYCGFPAANWRSFEIASSLGSFYQEHIKGNFDCRASFVPIYDG